MNNKNFRKISKKELLEILLSQAKRIDELELELKKTRIKLNSKKITINESGSLAEASLKLNGVFSSAQEAVNQYLFNIKEKCKKIENKCKKNCEIEKENMIRETKEICEQMKKEADNYLIQIEQKIRKNTENQEALKNTKKIISKDKEITMENKVVTRKSNKVIKGRPGKNIKKRNVT